MRSRATVSSSSISSRCRTSIDRSHCLRSLTGIDSFSCFTLSRYLDAPVEATTHARASSPRDEHACERWTCVRLATWCPEYALRWTNADDLEALVSLGHQRQQISTRYAPRRSPASRRQLHDRHGAIESPPTQNATCVTHGPSANRCDVIGCEHCVVTRPLRLGTEVIQSQRACRGGE